MSYSITLTSSVQNIGDDTLQMKIIFTVDDTGSNEAYTFAEKNIRVTDWNTRKLSFNLDEPLLVPAEYSCEVSDDDEYLKELFFNKTALGTATSKRPEIQVYENGSIKYDGIVKDQAGFDYNFAVNRVKLVSDAYTEDLNQYDLFDEEGNSNNVLSYTENDSKQFIDMLEDIFTYVNNPVSYSGGSLIIDHDWLFKGLLSGSWLEDLTMEELRFLVKPIFFTNDKDLGNLGDVLKRLALEYGAFTGFTRKGEAFFKKLYRYDAGNSQNLNIIAHSGGQPNPVLTYVESTVNIDGGRPTKATPSGVSSRISKNKINYGGLYINCATGFYYDTSFSEDPEGTNVLALRSGSYYYVYSAKDPNIEMHDRFGVSFEWAQKAELSSRFWWTHRGRNTIAECDIKPKSKEIHNFTHRGIGVDYLKGFPYAGEGFQIIELEEQSGKGITNIKAVNCGEIV